MPCVLTVGNQLLCSIGPPHARAFWNYMRNTKMRLRWFYIDLSLLVCVFFLLGILNGVPTSDRCRPNLNQCLGLKLFATLVPWSTCLLMDPANLQMYQFSLSGPGRWFRPPMMSWLDREPCRGLSKRVTGLRSTPLWQRSNGRPIFSSPSLFGLTAVMPPLDWLGSFMTVLTYPARRTMICGFDSKPLWVK